MGIRCQGGKRPFAQQHTVRGEKNDFLQSHILGNVNLVLVFQICYGQFYGGLDIADCTQKTWRRITKIAFRQAASAAARPAGESQLMQQVAQIIQPPQ